MRKPLTIVFGTDDVPPLPMLLVLGVQHVLVLSVFLVSPVAIAQAAELPPDQARDLISLTMIALAIATLLQVRRGRIVGSGLLAVPTSQSVYVPGCLIAVRLGGLPAMAALLLLAGGVEMLLSRFLRHLRGLLPTELSGLIVLVTGLAMAQTGMDNIVASLAAEAGTHWLQAVLTTAVTLSIMVGCSVWGRGPLRTLGAILGLCCGYAAGWLLGLIDPPALAQLAQAPFLRLPGLVPVLPHVQAGLVLPALVTGLAITLNSTGALTAAQKLDDADWKRQDIDSLSRGLLADGLGTMIAALLGGCGISASGSSVGLTATARATSRAIGHAVAAGFAVLSLVPKFALLVLAVPRPVLGAALIYLSCALLISGISIMSSRLLDTRKTFCLGIAFAFAVATPSLTRVGAMLPDWMAPLVASPLLASALVAILLNPLLRLGIRRQQALPIPPGGLPHQEVTDFIARAGASWGARREVIEQAQGLIAECLDVLVDQELAAAGSRLVLGFNELQLDARLVWQGAALPLTKTRPTRQEMLLDDSAAARMAV